MLSKGDIISNVLLMLGNVRDYNEPTSEEHKIADTLFDKVIDELVYNKRLLFNAATVKLNYAQSERNYAGEYKYLLPYGLVNLIGPADIRMEGEFIYSRNKDQHVKYCKKILLNEIPDYMIPLITYRLAMEMCLAYSQYLTKLELFMMTYDKLLDDLYKNEVDGFNRLV